MFTEGSILANYFYLGLALLCLASFIAGYVDSIAGGGGLITMPAFLMLGFLPQNAMAQAKFVSGVGTMVAIKNFIKSKSIIWKIIPLGFIFALFGAFVGSKIILILSPKIVYYIILILMPFGLLTTLYKSRIKNQYTIKDFKYSSLLVSITCFMVGFYDGFFGPGTGSILIICLYTINKVPLLNASATTKIINFASNLGAFITFTLAGKVAFLIGLPMVLASMLGNHLGSMHAIKTNGDVIKKVLVITVAIMFVTVALQVFGS
jgi:uncharacterized protein